MDNSLSVARGQAISEGLRKKYPNGRAGHSRSLSDVQVLEIKQRLASGEGPKAIATDFGVAMGVISKIVAGHSYRGVVASPEIELALAERAKRPVLIAPHKFQDRPD